MSNQDWYCKSTWTKDDQDDFFAHLKRSRKSRRAQYLKIQAYYLLESGSSKEIEAALELANLAIREYPEKIFLAELFEQRARCFDKLGSLSEAEENYQMAFDAMRQVPNVRPNIEFSFGLFVIEHTIVRLYGEVIQVLDEFTDRLFFPTTAYYYFGIKAVIFSRENNQIEAKSLALKALEASDKKFSGLSHHPQVGVVIEPDKILHKELLEIVR
jgi:tetratricopeptide (TPR) repeat protein